VCLWRNANNFPYMITRDEETRISTFWVIMLCSPCSSMKQLENIASLWLISASCWILAWLVIGPWKWRQHIPPKRQLTCSRLQGIISQDTELLILNAGQGNSYGVAYVLGILRSVYGIATTDTTTYSCLLLIAYCCLDISSFIGSWKITPGYNCEF
jgi:hypothetical protein